jgi:hypothetical protein
LGFVGAALRVDSDQTCAPEDGAALEDIGIFGGLGARRVGLGQTQQFAQFDEKLVVGALGAPADCQRAMKDSTAAVGMIAAFWPCRRDFASVDGGAGRRSRRPGTG